jgi:hypothetical protein
VNNSAEFDRDRTQKEIARLSSLVSFHEDPLAGVAEAALLLKSEPDVFEGAGRYN